MLMRTTLRKQVAIHCKGQSAHVVRTSAPWQCTKRYRNTSARPTPSSDQNGQDGAKAQPKGSYLRSFALLAIGVPLGWMIGDQINGKTKRSSTADPGEFVKYTLVDRQPASSTSSIFTLRPSSNTVVDLADLELQRAVTSVQFKQPQLQIARSYTVLPAVEGQEAQELRFLIRKEQKGEVSGYLHRLAIGAEIEVRGPSVEYVLPERVSTVAFLAGGTGIVPALQIADKVAGDASFHLLWANRRREDCAGGVNDTSPAGTTAGWNLFGWWTPSEVSSTSKQRQVIPTSEQSTAVAQLESIKARTSALAKLNVDYFVDEEGSFIRPDSVKGLVLSATRKSGIDTSGERLLFVSGPEGFVNYWAGPKQWYNGQEVQGPLGGVLSTVDLRGWKVVKL